MEQRTVFSTARNVDHERQPDAAQTLKQIGLCRREASERVPRDRLAILQAACQGTGSDWTDIPSGVPAMHGAGLTFSLSRRAAGGMLSGPAEPVSTTGPSFAAVGLQDQKLGIRPCGELQ